MAGAQDPPIPNLETANEHDSPMASSAGKDTPDNKDGSAPVQIKADANDGDTTTNATSTAVGTSETCEPSAKETKEAGTNDDLLTEDELTCETVVLFCGSNKWDLIGRKSVPAAVLKIGGSDAGEEHFSPTRLTFPQFPSLRFKTAISGPCAAHFVLLTETGDAYVMGRNDHGQLACPDLLSRPHPVRCSLPSSSPDPVVTAACGRSHTLLVTKSGACYAAGLNSSGNLGVSYVSNSREPDAVKWTRVAIPSKEKIISVAAGAEFSVWACASGSVYSAGSGQYGQLGNGRTGEHILSKRSLAYDNVGTPQRVLFPGQEQVSIVQVAAGTNHSVALDSDGKVWSWGFGGYGRLGHSSPDDELRPRLIDMLNAPHTRVGFITCGATSSFAVLKKGTATYFWGISKRTGESFMYPKPLFDLQGCKVHCLASGNSSTVLATERMVVSWGASPTYGELGYGKGQPKSSTKPKVIEPLEGLYCRSVAEGMAFTVLVVHIESDDDRKILNKLGEEEWGMDRTTTKRKAEAVASLTKQSGKKDKRNKRIKKR